MLLCDCGISSLSFASFRPVEQRCHDPHGAHQSSAGKVRKQVDRGDWVLVLPEREAQESIEDITVKGPEMQLNSLA